MQFSSLPISSSLHNNPRYQFSLKSENIEIVPILSAAILKIVDFARDFFWVRIFYQPYLIYMPSLVEIPLAVSDISEVNYFDICSQFPWQRRPFWKFQDWMGIHLPVKFSKDQIISLLRIWLDKFTARRRRGRIIIFNYSLCWSQYEFLWTLKTIFTEAFRLRWILISKVHKNSHWPIQKTVIVLLH
jgi:uncharacterized membrane protein YciS (DUF1049 family)